MNTALVTRRTARSIPAFVWLTVLAVACGDDMTSPKSPEFANARADASRGGAQLATSPSSFSLASSGVADPAGVASPAPPAPNASSAQPAAVIAPTMVIRNGTVTIEVDSLELAISAVEQVAVSLGGYVGNTSQQTGSLNVRSATIELKIPAARYDNARRNLQPIGKIESETSTAQDVGEEFFDVTARQANAHRLEERLIALLATRTGKLEDVLAVERELARVREEIERYEGRLRYLKANVATSTLVVTVHEKAALVSQYTGRNVIVEAFKDAWRIFVSFVSIAISSLGFLIPLALLLAAGYLVWKRMKRRS